MVGGGEASCQPSESLSLDHHPAVCVKIFFYKCLKKKPSGSVCEMVSVY